jgi:DNA-binding transcriptional MocR family regulator
VSWDASATEGTVTRTRHFAQVPDALIADTSVSHLAVRLWARLDRYAGKNGRAFPSRKTLAEDLGVSMSTITRALAELSTAGWVHRTTVRGPDGPRARRHPSMKQEDPIVRSESPAFRRGKEVNS